MEFGAQKNEQIKPVGLTVRRFGTLFDSVSVLLLDKPELTLEELARPLGPREMEEGRAKTSAPARRQWLLGRLAAKEAAGLFWQMPPARMEVVKGPDGAPELWLPQGRAGSISISHTPGGAAAVAGRVSLGVDLERLDRRMSPAVRRWAFTPAETALAEALEGEPGFSGFLALWCAREAAAKSWGRGLLNHLDQVRVGAVDWPAGRLWVDWLGEEPRRAEVELLVADDFLLAVAGGAGEPVITGDSPQIREKKTR